MFSALKPGVLAIAAKLEHCPRRASDQPTRYGKTRTTAWPAARRWPDRQARRQHPRRS